MVVYTNKDKYVYASKYKTTNIKMIFFRQRRKERKKPSALVSGPKCELSKPNILKTLIQTIIISSFICLYFTHTCEHFSQLFHSIFKSTSQTLVVLLILDNLDPNVFLPRRRSSWRAEVQAAVSAAGGGSLQMRGWSLICSVPGTKWRFTLLYKWYRKQKSYIYWAFWSAEIMLIIQVVCQWSDKHNGTWPQWWRRRVQVDHPHHHHHHHHHHHLPHHHHGRCSGWSMSERWLILSLQNVDCSSSTRRILSRRWCSKNKWKKRWEQSWRWKWVWWWCQWSAHAAWVIFQAKDFVKCFKRRLYRIIIIYGFTKH